MLRNNADVRRCSYFELGLPVRSLELKIIQGQLTCIAEMKGMWHCFQPSVNSNIVKKEGEISFGERFTNRFT